SNAVLLSHSTLLAVAPVPYSALPPAIPKVADASNTILSLFVHEKPPPTVVKWLLALASLAVSSALHLDSVIERPSAMLSPSSQPPARSQRFIGVSSHAPATAAGSLYGPPLPGTCTW